MAQELIQGDSTDFIKYHDSSAYETCVYACTGLGAAETVAVARNVGGSWVTAGDVVTGVSNNPVVFTGSGGTPASASFYELAGGYYRFDVSADPAGTVLITADVGRKKA